MVRNRGGITKDLKDYMVPIIWLILIIVLVFSIFSWDDNEINKINKENQIWLELKLDSSSTDGVIVFPWDNKEKLKWDTTLYKWEKVIIKDGSISLSLPTIWDLRLNKLWELKYWDKWDLFLFSSDLWINSKSKVNLNMRYAKVSVWNNTNISFSQNEVGSTIYLISWYAEVSNLVWESTVLASWQKITISRLDTSKEDLDLSILKEELWDYYKKTDWFLKNNWNLYLKVENNNNESTWTIKKSRSNTYEVISFNNLIDESQVSSSSINISWNYYNDNWNIESITLNWKEAILNKENNTFKFEWISTWKKINDLVFRIYDDFWDTLDKILYTVYYDSWTNISKNWAWWFTVETYDVDWSKFTFTSPSATNSYTTYDNFVTIKWKVLQEWISSVTINDYKLKSFNWNTWRYHAKTISNNLKLWTNVYEIKYFNKDWDLSYTNHYTIVMKKNEPKVESKETKTFSSEIKIQ